MQSRKELLKEIQLIENGSAVAVPTFHLFITHQILCRG